MTDQQYIYKLTFLFRQRQEEVFIVAKNEVSALLSRTAKSIVDVDEELVDIHTDKLGEVVIENDLQ